MASFPEQIIAAIEKLQFLYLRQEAEVQSLKSCVVALVGEVFGGGKEVKKEAIEEILRTLGESQARCFENLLFDMEDKFPAEAARLSELADRIREGDQEPPAPAA